MSLATAVPLVLKISMFLRVLAPGLHATKERHPLGCLRAAKAQTVSITQKAEHSEMWISGLPAMATKP